VVAEGPPAKVFTAPRLGALYDMDLRVTEFEGRPLVLHHL
jgi:iron complex transport system ATP-binding protein